MKRMKRLVVQASAEYRTRRAKEAMVMSYADNLMPGVTLAEIDRAAGETPEDDGLWWDDEWGCLRDTEAEYCHRCSLLVPLDSESGMCADCIDELAALAKERAG